MEFNILKRRLIKKNENPDEEDTDREILKLAHDRMLKNKLLNIPDQMSKPTDLGLWKQLMEY
jgi:hypothetical protein